MDAPDPQNLRRQFRLPAEDEVSLDGLKQPWETAIVTNQRWLLVYDEKIPVGYNVATTNVAILIAPGYPLGPLDMAYFCPHLIRASGAAPQRSEGRVNIDNRSWQGWSRHRTAANPWTPGEDNLESHYFYVRAWLIDELNR